jgi:hypothetical protein
MLLGCGTTGVRTAGPLAGAEWGRQGFSGAAPFGAAVLVVHDAKFDPALPRLGVIELPPIGPARYRPVAVADWRGRVADDLEAVCALTDRDAEFLAIESSHRRGAPARLFRLHVTGNSVGGWTAEVLGTVELPRSADATPMGDAANYEGLACILAHERAQVWVLLGERGGSRAYPAASLRVAKLSLDTMQFELSPSGPRAHQVLGPAEWQGAPEARSIADVVVDASGILWASATRDPSDGGPFASLIYPVARVVMTENGLVVTPPTAADRARWRLDGVKVEGLTLLADGRVFFATDDESFGGAFGFLPGD